MEKSQKKKIALTIVNWVVTLAIFAAMFAISISAGVCSIVFSCIGYFSGWFAREHKIMQNFCTSLVADFPALKEGQSVVFTIDESDGSISTKVSEPKQKKSKKEA